MMALAVPAVASAATAKTTLTYDGAFLGNGQSFWSGKIKSANRACALNRRVTVYMVKPGADKKIGSTKSVQRLDGAGFNWDLALTLAVKPGRYYAMVKASPKCTAAKSKARRFVAQPPTTLTPNAGTSQPVVGGM
jgi:hypothetical protein